MANGGDIFSPTLRMVSCLCSVSNACWDTYMFEVDCWRQEGEWLEREGAQDSRSSYNQKTHTHESVRTRGLKQSKIIRQLWLVKESQLWDFLN